MTVRRTEGLLSWSEKIDPIIHRQSEGVVQIHRSGLRPLGKDSRDIIRELFCAIPLVRAGPGVYPSLLEFMCIDESGFSEKAHKIVYKNLKENAVYYSQLHLAGYNEDAMKKDRKKRTDLPTEVKKDNFIDAANGVKKVKMDKLTEDELKVLVGNILAEVADQKKTNLNESIEDNIAQIVNDKSSKYTFYNDKHKADMQKIFRMSAIKQILKNPNLTDEDRQKLEAELTANKPEIKPTTQVSYPDSLADLIRQSSLD